MREMLTVHQAQAHIRQHLSPLSGIKKPLEEALGYYLASDVAAERDYPPFDRITMDGMAVHSSALRAGRKTFSFEAYGAAGSPQVKLRNPENAIEVATGAPLPEGCDTVIPYELFSMEGGTARLHEDSHAKAGEAIHKKAGDAAEGQILLKAGQLIGVPEMTVLAGNGVSQVPVHAKPTIGILATGNELVAIDAAIEPHQIRRSNDLTLKACLAINGFLDVECDWVPDEREAISAKLSQWTRDKKIVLITGGVSRGARDYVPEVLERIGVKEIFHRVAQRPGKPLWFGRTDMSLVFGLPGNPNSSLVCLVRYVLPALRVLSGGVTAAPPMKKLAAPAQPLDALTLFMPASLQIDGGVLPVSTTTSGDFTGLLGSDGFLALPPGKETYAAGYDAEFYPWRMR